MRLFLRCPYYWDALIFGCMQYPMEIGFWWKIRISYGKVHSKRIPIFCCTCLCYGSPECSNNLRFCFGKIVENLNQCTRSSSDVQGWHIGIGRYEISADIAHIGKTDISVSVIIPTDTYRPICNIGNPFHIGGYRSKYCILYAKNHYFMNRNNISSHITVILMTITWQMASFWHSHLLWAVNTALIEVLTISSRFHCSQPASK